MAGASTDADVAAHNGNEVPAEFIPPSLTLSTAAVVAEQEGNTLFGDTDGGQAGGYEIAQAWPGSWVSRVRLVYDYVVILLPNDTRNRIVDVVPAFFATRR